MVKQNHNTGMQGTVIEKEKKHDHKAWLKSLDDLQKTAKARFTPAQQFSKFLKNLETSYHRMPDEKDPALYSLALHKLARNLIEHPELFSKDLKGVPDGINLIFEQVITDPELLKLSWDPLYSNLFWKHFSKEQQAKATDLYAEAIKAEDNNLLMEDKNAQERVTSALEIIDKFSKPSWVGFMASSKEKYRAAIYLKILKSDELSPFAKNVALYSLMSNKSDLQTFLEKNRRAHLETLENYISYTILRSPNNLLGKSERESLEKQIRGLMKQVDHCIKLSLKSNNIAESCLPLLDELKQIEKQSGLAQIMPKARSKNLEIKP